ncbi:hypothetical protein [Mesonia sp. K4-1]|uniref:hypothetical protein n=1 Tax=Mesonia sp. K4-1 TaxID=2602760 RepID=UPI0011C97E14|nr:hypothetical protein [Mesonia sp. K4-1]TXK74461.1 hypothetical protein FT986_11385 [Mesonia sp. K4-1]
MKKFRIFDQKFTWTRTLILNILFWSNLLTIIFLVYIVNHKNSDLITALVIFQLPIFLIGFILKILGINKYKKIKGELTDSLKFSEEYIYKGKEKIPISKIDKLKISAVDYFGREDFSVREWNFENGLSNGVYNFLEITYKNKSSDKIKFQMTRKCEFIDIKNIIEYYYSLNKIDYLNCVDLLCLTEKNEWNKLKNKTTANKELR